MRLARDLAVLAALCLGFYVWRHRPAPRPRPLFAGEPPTLAMPASSNVPPRPNVAESMLVEKESLGTPEVHLNSQRAKIKTLGETPQLLSGAAAPSLDEAGPSSPPDERPSWLDKAATPGGMAAVFGLFALCYLILGRALRKGPGGRGFTHD